MPTWFARRVLDLAGVLTDIYYRRKYGAMARRLGRPTVAPDERRGFILLQIDGLANAHLIQALDEGYLPTLNRLITSNRLKVAPWRCGLPSSTPAVQAGMMFGNRFDIPGFRWYEKDRRTLMSPQQLDQIPTMHRRISDGRPGILSGGSCYVSIFDGDAELALFTLSTLRRQRFFESLRGVGLLVLFLLSPFRVLRVTGRALADYASKLGHRLLGLIRAVTVVLHWIFGSSSPFEAQAPMPRSSWDIVSPLVQASSEALFTEVQTFGVMLDIYRRVPAIYANYNGYDEAAHEMGPTHPTAFRVLRSIDRRIRQIDRMRANYQGRSYDLYVISDHGNTAAVTFASENGVSLGEHIARGIEEGVSVHERVEAHTYVKNRARYLREELRALEEGDRSHFQGLLTTARRYVDQTMEKADLLDYDLRRERDIVVSASGSLAHIYFNVARHPLEMMEVLILYPGLLDWLTATPGIGAVIGRAGDRTIVLGSEGGTLEIGREAELADPPDPLAPYGDASYAERQIHQLAHFPHAGDLIVLGAMREDGRVVTFENQLAAHGGLGGPQTHPFIAWPPERDLRSHAINDPEDLYPVFRAYHQVAPGQ